MIVVDAVLTWTLILCIVARISRDFASVDKHLQWDVLIASIIFATLTTTTQTLAILSGATPWILLDLALTAIACFIFFVIGHDDFKTRNPSRTKRAWGAVAIMGATSAMGFQIAAVAVA